MPLISVADDYTLYGATAVENLFLMEFMPAASGDCVRVYLYILLLAQHPELCGSVADLARTLGMGEEDAVMALRYWEQKGLLTGLGDDPLVFRLNNVRSALMSAKGDDDGAYRYSAFNERLQQIYGLLHPRQFTMAIEWIEDLHLPEEVVLYMAEQMNEVMKSRNGGRQRSVTYSFKTLNATAMEWAQNGVNTLEKARMEIQKQLPPAQVARKVLDRLSLKRNPTSAELELAGRWLNEWHYTEEDVMAAIPETTRAANPSFHYLDGVLKNHRTRAFDTPLALELAQVNKEREELLNLLDELGARARVTDSLLAEYRSLTARGIPAQTILYASRWCSQHGRHTFQALIDLCDKWLQLGLTTPKKVEAYLEEYAALRPFTVEIFSILGREQSITEADLDQTREWLEKQPNRDIIRYAAQCARGLQLPQRSITRRLEEFHRAGIVDLADAKAFKRPARGQTREQGREEGVNPALRYAQRKYDEKDLNSLFTDLNSLSEK